MAQSVDGFRKDFSFSRSSGSIDLTIVSADSSVYPPSLIGRVFAEETCRLDLSGKKLLDLGCGTGILGVAAAKCGAIVTCSDVDPRCLEVTQANAKLNGVRVQPVIADAFSGLNNERFEYIICN